MPLIRVRRSIALSAKAFLEPRVAAWTLTVATLICASSPVARADTFTVAWTGNDLTVVAADAPLAAVLSEVGRQTGVTFVGLDRVSGVVTVEIRRALLYDALATLLDGRSYVMTKPAEPDAVLVWLEGRRANRMLTDLQRTTRRSGAAPEQRDSGLPEGFDPTAPYDIVAAREFRGSAKPGRGRGRAPACRGRLQRG